MLKIRTYSRSHSIASLLIIGGSLGFLASFILTIDNIKTLQNPSYIPACNLNPIISCGSVMKTAQSSVFGFANSLIGISAFSMLIAIGIAIIAGAKFKHWFWVGISLALFTGFLFVHWLIFESLYRIGSLCPYCMIVWAVTIPIFWYVLIYNLEEGNIRFNKKFQSFFVSHHFDIFMVWTLIIVGLILKRFWYFWETLI